MGITAAHYNMINWIKLIMMLNSIVMEIVSSIVIEIVWIVIENSISITQTYILIQKFYVCLGTVSIKQSNPFICFIMVLY